jgi:hypothetical protein
VFENNCTGSVDTDTVDVWINELHYDNIGKDKNKLVEVAGPANTNLSGCKSHITATLTALIKPLLCQASSTTNKMDLAQNHLISADYKMERQQMA